MRLYLNLRPSRAHLWEAVRDPRTLGQTVFLLFLLVTLRNDIVAHANPVMVAINGFATAVWSVVLLNEVGLATLRHEGVKAGFQRPLPPRYGTVFERMLGGFGIYLYMLGLGCLLVAFVPGLGDDGLNPFLFAGRLILLGAAWYGITYSNTRYQAWYEEIWPNDDEGGDGWDDVFIPDPTPQDHRAI